MNKKFSLDLQDLQITGVSAIKSVRAATPVEETSKDFFLKLIENTIWSNNKIQMKKMLDSTKNLDKNIYSFLKNKNGLECLKIYQTIEKCNDNQQNKNSTSKIFEFKRMFLL